jgi:hypothetical protein
MVAATDDAVAGCGERDTETEQPEQLAGIEAAPEAITVPLLFRTFRVMLPL